MAYKSSSFLDVWHFFTCSLNQEELVEVAALDKLIWDRRNIFIHQGVFTHPNVIVNKARQEISSFKEAHSLPVQSRFSPSKSHHKVVPWSTPIHGIYKVNWDSTFYIWKIGMEVIIYDWEGKVHGTFQASWSTALTPFTVEAMIFFMLSSFTKKLVSFVYT